MTAYSHSLKVLIANYEMKHKMVIYNELDQMLQFLDILM